MSERRAQKGSTSSTSPRHPAPGPGLEKAPLGPPARCKGPGDTSQFYSGSVMRTLEQFSDKNPDWGFLVDSAKQLCNADPKNAVVQRVAQEIVQDWINTFGETTKESVEDLALRLDKDQWTASTTPHARRTKSTTRWARTMPS